MANNNTAAAERNKAHRSRTGQLHLMRDAFKLARGLRADDKDDWTYLVVDAGFSEVRGRLARVSVYDEDGLFVENL